MNTLEIVSALKVLSETALTISQISKLLSGGEITEEQVELELLATDELIDRLDRED